MGLGKRGKGWWEGVMDCSGVSLKACPSTGPVTQEQCCSFQGHQESPFLVILCFLVNFWSSWQLTPTLKFSMLCVYHLVERLLSNTGKTCKFPHASVHRFQVIKKNFYPLNASNSILITLGFDKKWCQNLGTKIFFTPSWWRCYRLVLGNLYLICLSVYSFKVLIQGTL